MNEQQALEQALTEWLDKQIEHGRANDYGLDEAYSSYLDANHAGGRRLPDGEFAAIYARLETLLNTGKWRVVLVEE